MRILIVDDTTTARIFTKKCLKNIGLHDAEFIMAINGLDALDKIREKRPDLIFTDLMMPEMDGESLLRELKSDPDLEHIPVIVVSSVGNIARQDFLLEVGARNVLPKPISSTEIYDVLKEFVDDLEEYDGWGD